MKVLVFGGSPKGKASDTMKLTNAFLEGLNPEICDVVDTFKERVNPCLGCFGCWNTTPGKCVQNDGMENVLNKMKAADVIIWSFPLYCYGVPSTLKAYIDRLLPLTSPIQATDENGNTYHPSREEHSIKTIVISGSGFPDMKGNFDGVVFSFKRMFGEAVEFITCVESPLMNIPEAEPVVTPYLELVKRAGEEFKRTGKISDRTHAELDTPMLDPEEYRRNCNS